MAYDSTDLTGLDPLLPDDTASEASELGPAMRETRRLLRDLLRIAHNDDGTLKAVAGSLISAGTLLTAALSDSAVTAAKLATDAVTTAKLANAAVTGDKVATATLLATHFADAAITSAKLASVDAAKLTGTIPTGRFGTATIPAAALSESVSDAQIVSMALGKLTGLADGQVIISVSGVPTAMTITGDISVSNTGAVTLLKEVQLVGFGQLLSRGQNGGQATSTWTPRTITEVSDVSSLMAISGTAFTLAAGRYLVYARCPAYGVGRHQAGLFIDDTTDAILLWGSAAHAPIVRDSAGTGTTGLQTDSVIIGQISVADTDQLVFKHWVQTSAGGDTDFGVAASSDNTVNLGTHNEVYLRGYLIRLGDAS